MGLADIRYYIWRLPWWLSCKKNTLANAWRYRRCVSNPWVGKVLWRREWQPTPVFLPEEFHGQRSLAGPSPWGHKQSDTTERLTYTFTLYHVAERKHQTPNTLILPPTHLKHASFSNFTIITKPQLFQLQNHLSSELIKASIHVDSVFILIHPKLHAESRS